MLDVLGQMGQQRIDGLGLNVVRRIPCTPFVTGVFARYDVHFSIEPSQKHYERFHARVEIKLLRLNGIGGRKPKVPIQLNVPGCNCRLLLELAQGALELRLARVDVPFGNIKASRMINIKTQTVRRAVAWRLRE